MCADKGCRNFYVRLEASKILMKINCNVNINDVIDIEEPFEIAFY